MAHALVHILGSRSGYTTLDATAGLTSGDRAELEVLGFGDATSSEAMARLETHACMVGRRLRSGRFAISRMLPGGTDDKGRPTIEVVSLVLDASGYAAVAGAFARLAEDVRFWRLARGAVARGYELPEQVPAESAREPGVLRAFDTWVAARKTGSIGVLAAQDAQSLLAMVALLDGQDLGECRWGVGVVSLSAPVDICTLAPATAAIGSRPVLRAATGESWLSPEMAHVEFHVAQNPLLPPRASLVSAVHIEPALDRDAEATPVAAAPRASTSWRPSAPKRNLTMIAAITAAASLAVLVMTTAVYVRTGRVVDVVVDASASEYSSAPQADVVPMSPDSVLVGAYPPPPPASDRDDDGVPDEADPCPDGKDFERIVLFEDRDIDEDGNAQSVGQEFCVARGTIKHQADGVWYRAKHSDLCDGVQGVFSPTNFYLDADNDGTGSGSATPFCVKPETKLHPFEGRKYVLTSGDLCPEVTGLLEPKDFWQDNDADGLGNPSEPTTHCGYTLAGWADNNADTDDNVPAPKPNQHGADPNAVPGKRTATEEARSQLKEIVGRCLVIEAEVSSLDISKSADRFAGELEAQLAKLKTEEQQILDLQRSLHPARGVGGSGSAAPHRFVGRLWPVCQEQKCEFDSMLEADWRELLAVFSRIDQTIDQARSRYYAAVERRYANQGNKEHAIENAKGVITKHFDKAKDAGPKHLLNGSRRKKEIEYLDAQGKAGSK